MALALMAMLCALLVGWNTLLQLQINQNRHWMVHESHRQAQVDGMQTKTLEMLLSQMKKQRSAKPPCLAVPKWE